MPTGTEGAPAGRRIVVGVDGSPESRRALSWAGLLARATGAAIDVVTVCELPFPSSALAATPSRDWSPHADAEKSLVACVDEAFGPHRPAGLRTLVLHGDGARCLLEHAAGATALVVGSHGHKAIAEILFHPVGRKCVAHATCPVLVVHGHDEPPPV